MEIKPVDHFVQSHKQWSLPAELSVADIQNALPGVFDKGRSGDGKCTHQWNFSADGNDCAVWDYKGSRWSAFGPRKVFEELGWIKPEEEHIGDLY